MTIDERIGALARQVQTPGTDWAVVGPIWNMIGKWGRYLGFLRAILTRYEEANAAYMVLARNWLERARQEAGSGPRPMTPQEMDELAAQRDSAQEVHLQVESFYQFAKILLDRVATCMPGSCGTRRTSLNTSKTPSWFRGRPSPMDARGSRWACWPPNRERTRFPRPKTPPPSLKRIETYIGAVVDFLERHRDQSVLVRPAP